MKKFGYIFLCVLMACGGSKMPKDQYDAVYKAQSKGYPEYLLIKKISDSTYSFLFYPEDAKVICEIPRKGIATNPTFRKGPDIVVDKDGNGISTYGYTLENYKCKLTITLGFTDILKVHSHCNGGNMCPEDTEYKIEK